MLLRLVLYLNRIMMRIIIFFSSYLRSRKRFDTKKTDGRTLVIVRHGGIGDLLFVSSIFKKIKILYPGLNIVLITQKRYHSIFKSLKYLDIVLDYSVKGLFKILSSDYALFLDNSIEGDFDSNRENVYDLFAKKYAEIDLDDSEKHPIVYVDENSNSYLLEEIPTLSSDKIKVGVQIVSGSPVRTPRLEFWVKVILSLIKKNPQCVVVIICDFKNKHLGTELALQLSNFGVTNEIINFGDYSRKVDDLVSLITYLDFLVCPDSSVVHLAAALNVPSLSIYGPFPSRLRTKYYIKDNPINAMKSCAPCFTHGHKPCRNSVDGVSTCFDNIEMTNVESLIDHKLDSVSSKNMVSELYYDYSNMDRECYVIAKGPSLDGYSLDKLKNKLTFCINDSFKFIKDPSYVFFHDAVFKNDFEMQYSPEIKWILPYWLNVSDATKILCSDYLGNSMSNNVFLYHKYHIRHDYIDLSGVEFQENVLCSMSGTLHSAIHFASKIGVEKINFIGVDGGMLDGKLYSDYFCSPDMNNVNLEIYKKIKNDALALLDYLGIDFEFLIK